MDTPPEAVQYEIRVDKHLSAGIATLFPEFRCSHEADHTLLCGCLPDQSALHGILVRIRDLGLTLISVNRLDQSDNHQTE